MAAAAAARRAGLLDPESPGTQRLAAAVARARGEPTEADAALAIALSSPASCVECLVDHAGVTGSDEAAAEALAAGAHPAAVVGHLPDGPGPRTLAAWQARGDLDAEGLALRGRALLSSGRIESARGDLAAAAEAGVADADTLQALAASGDPWLAWWVARRAAARQGGSAAAQLVWFRLAWDHGPWLDQQRAAEALGALPEAALGGTGRRASREALFAGEPPPDLPAAAGWILLGGALAGVSPDTLATLPLPGTASGLEVWLRAAEAVRFERTELAEAWSVESWSARVLVEHALRTGDVEGVSSLAVAAWQGGEGPGQASWPGRLEAAGASETAARLRESATDLGSVAIAVEERAPGALARVEGQGTGAAHLLPLALLGADAPCAAVAAVGALPPEQVPSVPGLGDVGYAAVSAECRGIPVVSILRAAHAAVPSDGRLAQALGLAELAVGDASSALRFLSSARLTLPDDADLQTDLIRIHMLLEDQ